MDFTIATTTDGFGAQYQKILQTMQKNPTNYAFVFFVYIAYI